MVMKVNNSEKRLSNSTFNFGIKVIKILSRLPKDFVYEYIYNELTRAVLLISRYYESYLEMEFKNDKIRNIQLVLSEIKNTIYFLRVLIEITSNPSDNTELKEFIEECEDMKITFNKLLK